MLSERLKTIRTDRKLSRKALSELAGVAAITIKKIETPSYNYSPSVKILSRIAKGLEINVKELL